MQVRFDDSEGESLGISTSGSIWFQEDRFSKSKLDRESRSESWIFE